MNDRPRKPAAFSLPGGSPQPPERTRPRAPAALATASAVT